MKKRLLSILLCCMMLAELLPTVAFADNSGGETAAIQFGKGSITGYSDTNSYDYIYFGNLEAPGSYTAGNFVWNDDPYDTYVEITDCAVVNLDSNYEGGARSTAPIGTDGRLVGHLPTPTRDGYTFAGWYTEAVGGTAVTTETVLEENATIYAHWTVNQYTITFNTNGGSTIASITQDYGTDVSAPASPTKTGYSFGGWYSDNAFTTGYVFSTMPSENITLYTKWNPLNGIKYTVKHNFEKLDGTYETETEELSGVTDTDTAAQAKNMTGFTAGSVTQQKIKGNGSTVIEITYTLNTYTLTFKPENSGADIVTTVKYGAAITAPADLEKTGYTFAEWDKTIPDTMPAEDLTITARWTANRYAITVESAKNGSVTADRNTAVMGDTVTLTVDPEKGLHTGDSDSHRRERRRHLREESGQRQVQLHHARFQCHGQGRLCRD